MKNIKIFALILVVGVVLLSGDVTASTIGKGTISISTSSNTFYQIRKSDDWNDRSFFNFDVAGGYFIRDNLEIELGLDYDHTTWDDEYDSEDTWYGIDSMLAYHWPLRDNFNLYIGAGVGYGKYKYQDQYDEADENRISLNGKLGGEFFLNALVAITVGVNYDRYTWSSDDYGDDITANYFYIPHIGIKVFTTRPVAGD